MLLFLDLVQNTIEPKMPLCDETLSSVLVHVFKSVVLPITFLLIMELHTVDVPFIQL